MWAPLKNKTWLLFSLFFCVPPRAAPTGPETAFTRKKKRRNPAFAWFVSGQHGPGRLHLYPLCLKSAVVSDPFGCEKYPIHEKLYTRPVHYHVACASERESSASENLQRASEQTAPAGLLLFTGCSKLPSPPNNLFQNFYFALSV